MSLSLKQPNYVVCAFVLSVAFWICLFLLQEFKLMPDDKISAISAQIELIVHSFTLLFTFRLRTKLCIKDNIILKWLIFANICLFLNDLSFYYAVYFPNHYFLSASFFNFALGYIPYLIWIASIMMFLSKILNRDIFNLFRFSKMIPFFVLFNLLVTFLFFSSIHYAFHYFSWENISHITSFMCEFIIIDFSLICLVYSENKGVSLLLLGFITLISGDFFVNYSFLSQTTNFLKYGELLWFLGLIFILFGTLTIYQNKNYSIKNWFSQTNTIKNRLAFWSFGTSILSFLLFFIIAYLFSAIDKQLLLGLPIFIMLYSVIVVISSIYMGKRFEAPFKKLTANVEALMLDNNKSKIDNNFSTQEFIFLQKFIVDSFEVKEQKDRAQKALLNLAGQVAHDIRSPLTAINTALSDVTSIPENKRIMIRNAAKRINEIANNLLSGYVNTTEKHNNVTNDSVTSELIYFVLENIVSEKNYEYRGKQFKVLLEGNENTYSCFSKINLGVFKRILSNLINNSVEAMNSDGLVNIGIQCNAQYIEITIEDNGCGIPPNILPKITTDGFSFGKKSGAGFGLSHAKQHLEKINGTLSIESILGSGTTVNIKLLRAGSPPWFNEMLNINHDSTIVVLDDDPTIHDSWTEKFSQFSNVEIKHFSTVANLIAESNIKANLYLIDYELLAEKENGLDIIENLNLNHCALLVTSCFEDLAVRARCESLGVKIIPKPYVPFIPITFPDAIVFIDDDELMRMTWLFSAEQAGKVVDVYAHPNEFIKQMWKYNTNTIIYIDCELGENISGEVYAKELYERGFKEIHLTTGHPAERFIHHPWLRSVVGKTPPF